MNDEVCSVCGKRAIGCQILGCCGANVCEEHADPVLRALAPGERRHSGACYFVRFA